MVIVGVMSGPPGGGHGDTRRVRNAFTVDLEEYFHVEAFAGAVPVDDWARLPSRVERSTCELLDLLEAHDVTATFFVVGWVAERQPGLIRRVQARGHELACHGHLHRVVYSMAPAGFRADVRRARTAIEDASGAAVLGYRAPTCSIVRDTMWALEVLADEGFLYDSSIFPVHHDRYGIPDAPRTPHRVTLPGGGTIVELPMSTIRVGGLNVGFCGGGYFRLLPYRFVRLALRRLNEREGLPGVMYVHPWELDTYQPRLPAPPLTRFRHYLNLSHTARKVSALLKDFQFTTAAEVLATAGLVEVPA